MFGVNMDAYTAEDRCITARIKSDYELIQHGARYVGGILRLTGWQVEDLRYTPEEHLEYAREKAWAEFYGKTPAEIEQQQSIAAKWRTLAAELYPEHDFTTHHAVVSFCFNGKGTPSYFQHKRIVLETSGEAIGIGLQYIGRSGPRFHYAASGENPKGPICIFEPIIESTVEPKGEPLSSRRHADEPIATELLFSRSGYNKYRVDGVIDLHPLKDTELTMLDYMLHIASSKRLGY